MSLSVHNVERLMELRAQLVEQEHRPTKHTYTPMFAGLQASSLEGRMSKHTPGPWTVDDWQYSVPGRGHVPTIVNGQDAVAEAMGLWRDGADDTEEREANARLIAAAPELLEALQALIDWEAQPGQRVPLGIAGIIDSLVRPAIAKAEGRE